MQAESPDKQEQSVQQPAQVSTKTANQQQQPLPNINLVPQFIFGLKGDVRNNVCFIDDSRIAYPAGHNIIIYNVEDRSQQFVSGIEGSEGITAMAVSPSLKFMAICEQAERAICSIYDLSNLNRKKKTLCSYDYQSKKFVSVAFSPHNEKSHLLTLTADPRPHVILWMWDKQRCLSMQEITFMSGTGDPLQCSFHNLDPSAILVTGMNVYKYFKLMDQSQMKNEKREMVKKDAQISSNYTCHAWLPEGRIIVCTDQGELILLEQSGDFKMLLPESPLEGFYIECIITYPKGFFIGGDNGQIIIYDRSEEPKNPYRKIAMLPSSSSDAKTEKDYPHLQGVVMGSKVRSMALSRSEDMLLFTVESNQIMKVNINLERPTEDSKYEYLICPFHSLSVSGMDVCVKKQLVATCGSDKTVRIWSYAPPRNLEICEIYQDDAYSVAFHPSGFHILVGFTDKIRMMNVIQKNLRTYKEIPIKSCREIKFSHGGHLFAATNTNSINVFKFYTAENPPELTFKIHLGKVRCIDWFEDDSGFVSGGWDGTVNIVKVKDNQKPIHAFNVRNLQFHCVVMLPDFEKSDKVEKKFQAYCVGNDKTIKEVTNGSCTRIYEGFTNYQQLALYNGGRALFAGTSEEERPGSIQVLKFPNRISEVQAHSLPVERLRVSYDQNYLFSTGHDGLFCIFEIQDHKGKKDKESLQLQYSEEILILKSDRDKIQQDISNAKSMLEQMRINSENDAQREQSKKEAKIEAIKNDIQNIEIEHNQRYEQLEESKNELERMYKDKIEQMKRGHAIELERRQQDYQEKIDADEQRFSELEGQIDEENKQNSEQLRELDERHTKIIDELMSDQSKELQNQTNETKMLNELMASMMKEHKEKREEIENSTWEKIDYIKEKNKEDLSKIIEQGMDSKANLTIITNEHREAKNKKDLCEREIREKQTKLTEEINKIAMLNQQINNQKQELAERESTIKDKEKRIYELKRKTQELEKFKFVLDYKIKELKRDIGPRELEINKLNEQTNKMKQELKHFNRVNQNLALIVDDLRMRQEGLTNEVQKQRKNLDEQQNYIKKYKDDVYECLQHLADFKKLKNGVIRLHKKYVKEELKNEQVDSDLHREYAIKRKHLENNVTYLRSMLSKDTDVHRQENSRIMKENVLLLQEINDLRKECHTLKQELSSLISIEKKLKQKNKGDEGDKGDMNREMRMLDIQIDEYNKQIQELEDKNRELRGQKAKIGELVQQQYDEQMDSHQQLPVQEDEDQESSLKATHQVDNVASQEELKDHVDQRQEDSKMQEESMTESPEQKQTESPTKIEEKSLEKVDQQKTEEKPSAGQTLEANQEDKQDE